MLGSWGDLRGRQRELEGEGLAGSGGVWESLEGSRRPGSIWEGVWRSGGGGGASDGAGKPREI